MRCQYRTRRQPCVFFLMLAFSELYNNIVFHLQQHKAMHAGLYFENSGIIVAVEGLLYAENQVMASAPMSTIDFPM